MKIMRVKIYRFYKMDDKYNTYRLICPIDVTEKQVDKWINNEKGCVFIYEIEKNINEGSLAFSKIEEKGYWITIDRIGLTVSK
jgi:hypothetical protein